MVRKREFNRKISNDRVKKLRKPKRKIIIAVEGTNKTEKLYFSNYNNSSNSYSISMAKGNDTDPLNLVRKLHDEIVKRGMDLLDGDMAYCVFDTDIDVDKNILIDKAFSLANNYGIKIITSTPSIELWFLLHCEYTTARMSNEDVFKRLKKYYPTYEKNINIYTEINVNLTKAIERAKKLEKYQLDNKMVIGTVEANPNTEMYKIVEELIKG